MRRFLGILAAALVITVPVLAADTKVTLNGENTKITFVGTKADGKHEGGFKTITGTATASGTDPKTLKIDLDIDLDSLFTDNEKLTAHLKSPDFFNVKSNPKAHFVTTKVEMSDRTYKVTGDLTLISGITKSVSFQAFIAVGGENLELVSVFKINRQDFGIKFGAGKINDDVELTVKVKTGK